MDFFLRFPLPYSLSSGSSAKPYGEALCAEFWVSKRTLKKKGHPNTMIFRFWNRKNVLSTEGRCEAYPVGVQFFLIMFYFGLVNVLWKKKNGHPRSVIFAEFFLEMFYCELGAFRTAFRTMFRTASRYFPATFSG